MTPISLKSSRKNQEEKNSAITMNKLPLMRVRIDIILVVSGCAMFAMPFRAMPAELDGVRTESLHALEINRSLLSQSQADYQRLWNKRADGYLRERIIKKLKDKEFEIKALLDDASDRLSRLPQEDQSREFLKYLEIKIAVEKTLQKKVESPSSQMSSMPREVQPSKNMNFLDPLHQKASEFFENGMFGEAAEYFEKMTQSDTGNDQAYVMLGISYLWISEYEKSETALQTAARMERKNINVVISFFEQQILKNPNDDASYARLGYACLMLGKDDKAEQAFKNALAINAENEAAFDGLRILKESL